MDVIFKKERLAILFMLATKIKYGIPYWISSILLMIFAFIYELFSHQVYSKALIFSFCIPLGASIIGILFHSYSRIGIACFNISILTFTIGCILKGIFEIYGTDQPLLQFYWYFGLILLLISLYLFLFQIYIKTHFH